MEINKQSLEGPLKYNCKTVYMYTDKNICFLLLIPAITWNYLSLSFFFLSLHYVYTRYTTLYVIFVCNVPPNAPPTPNTATCLPLPLIMMDGVETDLGSHDHRPLLSERSQTVARGPVWPDVYHGPGTSCCVSWRVDVCWILSPILRSLYFHPIGPTTTLGRCWQLPADDLIGGKRVLSIYNCLDRLRVDCSLIFKEGSYWEIAVLMVVVDLYNQSYYTNIFKIVVL